MRLVIAVDALTKFYAGTTGCAISMGFLVFAGIILARELAVKICCDKALASLFIVGGAFLGFLVGLALTIAVAELLKPKGKPGGASENEEGSMG